MKKHKTRLFALAVLLLLCASCAPQARDAWAYTEPDDTWTETNRQSYLEVLYMYEGLRAGNVPENSSDAQRLQQIDERYKDLDTEAYMARESEVQYADMKSAALSMVEAYRIAENAPDLCFSHLRPSYLSSSANQWITALIYEDGYHYRLVMKASDGSFQGWMRYPQGYWTSLQYDAFAESAQEPLIARTDEELQNAVKAYLEAAPVFDATEIVIIETVTDETSTYVRVGLRPDKVYRMFIDHNDLSVRAVERTL